MSQVSRIVFSIVPLFWKCPYLCDIFKWYTSQVPFMMFSFEKLKTFPTCFRYSGSNNICNSQVWMLKCSLKGGQKLLTYMVKMMLWSICWWWYWCKFKSSIKQICLICFSILSFQNEISFTRKSSKFSSIMQYAVLWRFFHSQHFFLRRQAEVVDLWPAAVSETL